MPMLYVDSCILKGNALAAGDQSARKLSRAHAGQMSTGDVVK
jgi:hypothetical protein